VIITKNADPLSSFVKEVDVGNTIICYVPRNLVFKEPPNFITNQKNIVNVMSYQTDVNFSMALLCKPQQHPENGLIVWTVDDRIRQHAMWSSPELANVRIEEPELNMKTPWLQGKCVSRDKLKGRISQPTSRGPVTVIGVSNQATKAGVKKYQGKVPSIVALLTSHAKSQLKVPQKVTKLPEVEESLTKIFQGNHSGIEQELWQQKRFTPVSQEIHKALTKEGKQWQPDPTLVRQYPQEDATLNPPFVKMENITKGKKFGFSYHLDPPTTLYQANCQTNISFPSPPQMPLPSVPEADDRAIPGPSSRRDSYPSRPGVPDHPKIEYPKPGRPRKYEISRPVSYSAEKLSESVTFVNPYMQGESEMNLGEDRASQAILTPHPERQLRESTTLFIPEEVIKPHQVNSQKLSAVLVLSMFVVALLIFYLVYFI